MQPVQRTKRVDGDGGDCSSLALSGRISPLISMIPFPLKLRFETEIRVKNEGR